MPKGAVTPHKEFDRPLGCSLVLSRSEKEQEPCSALRKSCRQLQSTILSQRSQVHTAQVTPLKPSRHTPCSRGETQNTQALPQNIRLRALSVTFGDSSPRGRAKGLARLQRCISRSKQSLSPFGAAPFAQGSLCAEFQHGCSAQPSSLVRSI